MEAAELKDESRTAGLDFKSDISQGSHKRSEAERLKEDCKKRKRTQQEAVKKK